MQRHDSSTINFISTNILTTLWFELTLVWLNWSHSSGLHLNLPEYDVKSHQQRADSDDYINRIS